MSHTAVVPEVTFHWSSSPSDAPKTALPAGYIGEELPGWYRVWVTCLTSSDLTGCSEMLSFNVNERTLAESSSASRLILLKFVDTMPTSGAESCDSLSSKGGGEEDMRGEETYLPRYRLSA